jgi:hypothetical protein
MIFRPRKDEIMGGWRKLHNEELHKLNSLWDVTTWILTLYCPELSWFRFAWTLKGCFHFDGVSPATARCGPQKCSRSHNVRWPACWEPDAAEPCQSLVELSTWRSIFIPSGGRRLGFSWLLPSWCGKFSFHWIDAAVLTLGLSHWLPLYLVQPNLSLFILLHLQGLQN